MNFLVFSLSTNQNKSKTKPGLLEIKNEKCQKHPYIVMNILSLSDSRESILYFGNTNSVSVLLFFTQ